MVFFVSHSIQIYRKRRRGSSNKYSMSATLTVASADIQPMGVERTQLLGGKYGQLWDAYVDVSLNIKEGDQIVTNGKRYSVKGVVEWNGAGLLSHKELTLMSMDGDDA